MVCVMMSVNALALWFWWIGVRHGDRGESNTSRDEKSLPSRCHHDDRHRDKDICTRSQDECVCSYFKAAWLKRKWFPLTGEDRCWRKTEGERIIRRACVRVGVSICCSGEWDLGIQRGTKAVIDTNRTSHSCGWAQLHFTSQSICARANEEEPRQNG